jgi:integrase/recombinase XerD
MLGGLFMLLEVSLKEFMFECEVRKYTWKTIKGYRNNIEYLVNYLRLEHHLTKIEEVQTQHLKQFFMFQNKKKCKESYMNGLLKTYRAFFKYLMQEEYVKQNPILRVSWMKEQKSVIKTFSDDEVRAMINAFPGSDFLSVRNRAIIAMLLDTGIRCYELCTLAGGSVKDNYITIYGKGKKERQVGKSPYLAKILSKYERIKESYFEYKNLTLDHYFLSRTGRTLTNSAVEWIVSRACEAANVKDEIRCSPHTCRHYFAQAQLRNGMDVYSLSRVLGHENIKITQRYLDGLRDHEVVERSIKSSPLMNL